MREYIHNPNHTYTINKDILTYINLLVIFMYVGQLHKYLKTFLSALYS